MIVFSYSKNKVIDLYYIHIFTIFVQDFRLFNIDV